MQPTKPYRPTTFFVLTAVLSWAPWAAAAWLSFQPGPQIGTQLLMLVGLCGPFASALLLLRGDAVCWQDFKERLVQLRRLSWLYLPVTLLLMPAATYAALWLSLRLGRPASQLEIVPNLLSMVPLMLLAPVLEELGWRGYGVDALRARLGMRRAAFVFALLWALWHVPLFFIAGTYQHDLWLLSPVYVANFFASVVPAAIIANWLYAKHRRFIPAAILFHFMLDAVAIAFNAEQFTKCIVTGVFVAAAALIMLLDRKAFADGPRNFVT